jgi:class 3 adenylate cyclase
MSNVRAWLEDLGLPQYADAFEVNDIELSLLADLNDQVLKDIGVASAGHRLRLLGAIKAHAKVEKPTTDQAPSSAASLAARSEQPSPAAEGERRQLTVLFCDMVGFTELANRVDPEVLQKIIRAYEDACAVCITRYEGYVFQRLGDGIVAFFGYPLAHEGEAERAIHAGLAIIEALSKLDVPDAGRLAVRIGIATGLVVVSSTEKGAVGETMNLASRLQGIAPVGSIVVSARVQHLAGGAFDYEDLGEQSLKGIARPTRAYRILGVSEAASRFEAATQEGLTPLVGREQEIGLLMERWALAQDGEGQVVLLSGEPGIGKSRILSALRERLEAQGAQTLRFQCSPYYVNSAFWPSIDNFERALKFGRDAPPESKLDKLEALIVTHYGRPLTDVRFIAAMLSIPCEERYGALPMTPQKFKDETLRTLVDLTEAAARKQPSVMLFEDVHWADPTSLEVLDLLIDRTRTIPLLIVLTHRPEFQSRWAQHGHVTGLNLSKLTRTQSSALVSKVTGGKALPATLLEQILAKTDGVPLFVEELTKSILESGELKGTGDHYDYAGLSHTVTIPATLRDSLMARLDRFAPVKEIAQIGAAIGREFSHELIEAIAPMSKAQLDRALSQLNDSGLAFRRGTPPDAVYTFKHALVQDAAYDSLLKSRRQELHGKIARVIEERFPSIKDTEPEVLAHHYTQAGLPDQGATYWFKAGQTALGRMALTEAIAHLEAGLRAIGTLPASEARDGSELECRVLLSTAWEAYRGWPAPQLSEVLLPALPLARRARQPKLLARTLWGLWVNPLTQGRVAESLTWAEELLDAGKQTGDEELLLVGHMAVMVTQFWLGDLLAADGHGRAIAERYVREQHGQIVQAMNHDPKTLMGIYAAHWLWMLGYPDRAATIAEERDVHARLIGHPFDYGFALTTGAMVFYYRREPQTLHIRNEEAQKLGRDTGLPFISEVLAVSWMGLSLILEGHLAEGIELMQTGFDRWTGAGGRVNTTYTQSLIGEAIARTGDVDSGLSRVDAMLEQIALPGWGERSHLAEILRLKGWMLSLKGDLEGAEQNFLASLDWARHQQAKSWELRTSISLAKLWQSQGKRKEALDLLKPVYDWFTEGFDTKDLIEAKALLDELRA